MTDLTTAVLDSIPLSAQSVYRCRNSMKHYTVIVQSGISEMDLDKPITLLVFLAGSTQLQVKKTFIEKENNASKYSKICFMCLTVQLIFYVDRSYLATCHLAIVHI